MPQIIAIINTSLNFCGLILGGVDSWSVVSGHTQTFGTYIGTCTYYMQPLQVHWYVHVPEQTYLIHKFIKFRGCLEAYPTYLVAQNIHGPAFTTPKFWSPLFAECFMLLIVCPLKIVMLKFHNEIFAPQF